MDASELDGDVKLYKASGELLSDLLAKIPLLLKSPVGKDRKWVFSSKLEEVAELLDRFQEWPQLLDPHLATMLQDLVTSFLQYCIHNPQAHLTQHDRRSEIMPLPQGIARIVYALCKIRGQKVIVRLLNNEPKYVEPLLTAFRLWSNSNGSEPPQNLDLMIWEERYILLLWLSHLMLAPFELSSISILAVTTPEALASRINVTLPAVAHNLLSLALDHLQGSSKAREAASTLIIRLCFRGDMQALGLPHKVVSWALSQLTTPDPDNKLSSYHYIGLLGLLFGMVNSASDSESRSFLRPLSNVISEIATTEILWSAPIRDQAPARKLIVKIMRAATLHAISLSHLGTEAGTLVVEESLEETIQILLDYLSDKETPVRQAASKALSMIVLKLDADMSVEVIEAVLGCLKENILLEDTRTGEVIPITDHMMDDVKRFKKNVNAVDPLKWHGAMLTLGHLLFRRSPPVAQLSPIIEALLLGLEFEQRSNVGTSVGVGVRDAACFGLWSLARKYSTQELSTIELTTTFLTNEGLSLYHDNHSTVQLIAVRLVVSACLDPSGNLRRGSSAALQELIGRHPDAISQGIAVVQVVDYHAVARRSRAVSEVAVAVAELDLSYHSALQDALLQWRGTRAADADSRRHAANAASILYGTTPAADKFHFLKAVVPQIATLRSSNVGSNAAARHGLGLALAHILEIDTRKSDVDGLALNIEIISPLIDDMSLITGMIEGRITADIEYVLEATAVLVSAIAEMVARLKKAGKAKLSVPSEEAWIENAAKAVERCCLASEKDIVTRSAATASVSLFKVAPNYVERVRSWLDPNIQRRAEYSSKGRIDTMGTMLNNLDRHECHISYEDMSDLSNMIVEYLCQLVHGTGYAVEIRVNAMKSISSSLISQATLEASQLKALAHAIETGLSNYTVDQRGDIGSTLRLASIEAVQALAHRVIDPLDLLPLVQIVAKLAVERMAKIRFHAYRCLKDLITCSKTNGEPQLMMKEGKHSISLADFEHQADVSSSHYYVTMLQFQRLPSYHDHLIEGLISSVATASEDISRASSEALITAMLELSETERVNSFRSVLSFALHHLENGADLEDRHIVSVIDFMTILLEQVYLTIADNALVTLKPIELWKSVQKAHLTNSTLIRLEALLRLYSAMLFIADLRELVLDRLTRMLLHKWPKVRLAAATTIYLHFPHLSIEVIDWHASATSHKSNITQLRRDLSISSGVSNAGAASSTS